MIVSSVDQLIGQTPVMAFNHHHFKRIPRESLIYAKLEYFNPGGSIKDRLGHKLIEEGIKQGLINQATTIIEPTAGNTGIGIALAAQKYKLKTIFVIPKKFSIEKQQLIKALGAEIVQTDTRLGISGAINKAKEIQKKIKNSYLPLQFSNQTNPKTYFDTLGPEIYQELGEDITSFVAGIGSGGTFSGVSNYLKEKNPAIRLVGVEPEGSILNGGKSHSHAIEGIGVEFIPPFLETISVNKFYTISDEIGFYYTRELAKKHGILVGSSSGAAFAAALEEIETLPNGSKVVTIFPDSGDRYLSNKIYS